MRVGIWLLAFLPIIAIGEMGAHEFFRSRAPSEQEWELLEPKVRELYQPGTWVTVSPKWAEPLLRFHLGEPYFPLPLIARSDDDTLSRAILISFLGQENNELWRWERKQRETVGPFTLQVLENPHPETAKYRLIEHINPASLDVFDGPSGDPKVCAYTKHARVTTGGLGGNPTLSESRFVCPEGEPYGVAVTTIDDEAFRPRRCIFAHPSPNGPLSLVFRDVPIGKKIVGFAGLPWLISRDGVGSPIELTVKLEGERLGRHVVIDQKGYERFEWDTRGFNLRTVSLEVLITTERAQNRRLCFNLETR
jgi:hypothetical protein